MTYNNMATERMVVMIIMLSLQIFLYMLMTLQCYIEVESEYFILFPITN
jgi:hypothetical protein